MTDYSVEVILEQELTRLTDQIKQYEEYAADNRKRADDYDVYVDEIRIARNRVLAAMEKLQA